MGRAAAAKRLDPNSLDPNSAEHFDVLIVGAGISGIGGAYHLQTQCPGKRYVILETQESFGGTWLTHKYPGIRSDSDLFTFGYKFKPWMGPPIATADEILKYMGEVIDDNHIDRHIRYRHVITRATWSSKAQTWTVVAKRTDTNEEVGITCNFLWMCQGYYRHAEGYTPKWPGMDRYTGQIVHPQQWPEDLAYEGKNVLVIGSGATAATLVPAIANDCAHVTMLQRSPTYFAPAPNRNDVADMLRALDVPPEWTHEIVRRKILADQKEITRRSFEEPDALKAELIAAARQYLGDDFDIDTHFTPKYRPWRQRLAFIPDGDLFLGIRAGKASVVTDEIETFTKNGVLLKSGKELKADIIVTATGFNLCVLGDIEFRVDGRKVDFADTVGYRGIMFTGVPNMAWVFGYFRASWTLRADLIAEFVCRLLRRMDAKGVHVVTPQLRRQDDNMPRRPWVDPDNFNPGYLTRSVHLMPKQGDHAPWVFTQDYYVEKDEIPASDLEDGALVYSRADALGLRPVVLPERFPMPQAPRVLLAVLSLLAGSPTGATEAVAAADRAYHNGVIFTADATYSSAQALAMRDGKITYVGSDKGLAQWISPSTELVDLHGRFLMPGLIDGHMHPLQAGTQLLKCGLDYASLTVAELQARVQKCLDESAAKEPGAWLEVVNWFQESMLPVGVKTNRATLDVLKTKRPIIVRSSFGHTVLANTRALELANITADTQDPVGGKIWRDASGDPAGLLEDAAFTVFDALLPQPSAADNVAAARAALAAMGRQGVTTFLDAMAPEDDLAAFAAVRKSGALTARAHFAPRIVPAQAADPAAAVAAVVALVQQYDEGAISRAPGVTVRNAKLFLDGVIAAPALTGAMLEPYMANVGTVEKPHWVPGPSRGPAVYFTPQTLATLLVELGNAGIDPHMHADGDAAVRAALDGAEALRKALPHADIRPAIAHDEIVDPSDYARYRELDVTPVLSFQWGKPAGDTLGLINYFGPERMKRLEPAGLLAAAGARIAFGSDWPVDSLDEWFALKVGVTRTNTPDAPPEYRGRLGNDPGLSRRAVLEAATINAAYELHQDAATGSLEVGKYADLIVLDRNPLTVPAEEIANVRVLETVVGGTVVYKADAH